MFSPESFSHIQKTLRSAQELVSRVHKQNDHWPGGGALEKDVIQATRLLKEAQIGLIEVADAMAGKMRDVDFNYANLMFDQAYNILNLMCHDTKNIKISLEKGKSPTMAINELDMHLQKLIKHCREAQANMIED